MAQTIDTRLHLPTVLPPLSRVAVALAQAVIHWETRRLTRRGLARLDDHMLRDIGLHPATARAECSKPFWRG